MGENLDEIDKTVGRDRNRYSDQVIPDAVAHDLGHHLAVHGQQDLGRVHGMTIPGYEAQVWC